MKDSYNGFRKDLLCFSGVDFTGLTVLDFGCYRGANADYLKNNFSNVYYVGVENDRGAINELSSCVDELFEVDLDFFDYKIFSNKKKYDVVILGDVLEHLKYPEKFLFELHCLIDEDTLVLVSIPNIQYYQTFLFLFFGLFPRKERGIFDKTHLRWFTKKEFIGLINGNFKIEKFKRKFRLVENNSILNRFTFLFTPVIYLFAPFFTFQMYFSMKKVGSD